jgi:hypothetical protein
MVSARRVSRPSKRAASRYSAPADPHPCVALRGNNRVHVHAALARSTRARTRLPRVPTMQRRTAAFCSLAALRHYDPVASKRRMDVGPSEGHDTFCCKKFPTPIAAEKVPHYIRHYRALINQLTDPHLTECGD